MAEPNSETAAASGTGIGANMQDIWTSIRSVEERIQRIETKLWGHGDPSVSYRSQQTEVGGGKANGNLMERMHYMQQKLEEVEPEGFRGFYQQAKETDKAIGGGLFGGYPAITGLPRAAQHEYIVASENSVNKSIEYLKQIHDESKLVLDSEYINDVPSYEERLRDNEEYEMKFKRTSDLIRTKTDKMLRIYYEFIYLISQKLAVWDSQLKHLEKEQA
eukprot:gb/GECG01010249.1/.p1 GENE.gb/GECG01010249.1/~~gb/GECG01010249.1/.p1  ORF type:complete len:218 (+),score=43.27 gb/GECG01010249.1/:1-654(+)